ncbi:ribbon-helix-helix protein, CopG family [Subtercola lobariae]|nr:ribbon-helix-helix protein, CopG family [Subtercola lobariae]
MTVRLPQELDRQLDELAAREHMSKHALLLQGAELVVRARSRREDINRGMDFVLQHDAELLRRLEDA